MESTEMKAEGGLSAKLVSGLFWVLLANVVVKPLWILGIEVGVQNAVGNQMYGFYAALFSFSYIFNILLDLGVTNFNTRNIAQHPQLIGKHLSGILGIKIMLFGLYLVVTFSVGLLMGYGSDEFRLLALLTLCQFLNSLILYLRSNFEGLLLFKWDSLFSVLDRVIMIIICGFLLWGQKITVLDFQFSIYHFVYAQVIAYTVTALLALVVIGRKAGLRRLRWNWRFFLVILRKSAPFALLVLLMASYNRIDPILLRKLASDTDAGIYAGAFRLLDALTMVAYLVSVLLLPVFSRLCKTPTSDLRPPTSELRPPTSELRTPNSELTTVLRIVFCPMMLFAVGSAVACSLLADPLMRLLYHDNFAPYVPVFRVIIFGIIPIALTYIFGTLLTAGGHLRQLNIFAATSLVFNVVTNLLLIPRLGAVGAAWASLTTQTFMAVAQLLLAIRIFRLPLRAFAPPTPREIFTFLPSLLHRR
ncbi:MAG: oligosaccharide flippase family protein [Bacteroidales bacterium]|nr:oligosaccharide flippase family protein [Bacteroidales bacterium]